MSANLTWSTILSQVWSLEQFNYCRNAQKLSSSPKVSHWQPLSGVWGPSLSSRLNCLIILERRVTPGFTLASPDTTVLSYSVERTNSFLLLSSSVVRFIHDVTIYFLSKQNLEHY